MGNIALITSTIAPDPGVISLKRINVKDRLADYINAFGFYCECLQKDVLQRIVYVDNSGYSLDDLVSIARAKGLTSRIEFISYKSTLSPRNGRFYLELNLIDHAVKSSAVLNESSADVIWKITGRYLIKNLKAILSACRRSECDFYINCRNFPAGWADFYLVGFKLSAYHKVFSPNIHLYEGNVNGEAILRSYLESGQASDLNILRRLPRVPRVIGVRGYDGASYGGVVDSGKYYVRSVLNTLLPKLWI